MPNQNNAQKPLNWAIKNIRYGSYIILDYKGFFRQCSDFSTNVQFIHLCIDIYCNWKENVWMVATLKRLKLNGGESEACFLYLHNNDES